VTDLFLKAWMSALVERARNERASRTTHPWRPGQPIKLLFVGYNGARNTGSDVRVEEMLRQVRHVLGPDRVQLSVLTQDFALTRGYFSDAAQVRLPDIFPTFLAREIPRHHGVVTCEGSMFKSRFADALSTMMIGALGIASARNQLSVGYGAEAGAMSRSLSWMTKRYCGSSLVITRNEESERILRRLDVPTEPGTDTAWTFEPERPARALDLLRNAGWDGETPILGICPINPFWWPVRASLVRAGLRGATGLYRDSHYRSVYFHRSGRAVDAAYERYLNALAQAVEDFRSEHRVFPVLVAMERLDTDACRRLAPRIGGAPVFTSESQDMHDLVSVLRQCRLLVSSRFHAIVTSMPALVPSAGVTMDERIHNLMVDRGHEDLCLTVDAPDLARDLSDVLRQLWHDSDAISTGIGRSVVRNLRAMARMGLFLEQEVDRRFPGFPTRSGPVSWREYLPPLSANLTRLVDEYDAPETGEVRALAGLSREEQP
jgi:polysaccharide pyruvyl transferase WcaK-like protein